MVTYLIKKERTTFFFSRRKIFFFTWERRSINQRNSVRRPRVRWVYLMINRVIMFSFYNPLCMIGMTLFFLSFMFTNKICLKKICGGMKDANFTSVQYPYIKKKLLNHHKKKKYDSIFDSICHSSLPL